MDLLPEADTIANSTFLTGLLEYLTLHSFKRLRQANHLANPFSMIQSTISPKVGDDWVAVGLSFSSFELVNTTALLTASFGKDLRFAILAQSEISIPPDSPDRLAYAQLELEALFIPAEMLISVEGVLSRTSYVLDPDCHIQGGFLYELKGDGTFIVSYGGYAPDFRL